MKNQSLDEREFELVNIIGAKLASNQRDLSKHLELSLGQTNMLIKRLVSKGYIRITQLNKKKVKYLLTPKGIAEKMKKSVKYMMKTINSIALIKNSLRLILKDIVSNGYKNFFILGESDFAVLVEIIIKEVYSEKCTILHIKEIPQDKIKGFLLICREGLSLDSNINKENSINLVKELAKDDKLISLYS